MYRIFYMYCRSSQNLVRKLNNDKKMFRLKNNPRPIQINPIKTNKLLKISNSRKEKKV